MAYPDNFLKANAFTQKWERGYVNHKNDPGGATYNGVSLRFLKQTGIDINGDGKIDIEDILALYRNQDQARVDEIYYKAFWLEPGLDRFTSSKVQCVFYDSAVNTGRTQTAKFLQRAVNELAAKYILQVDGIAGPKTVAAANGMSGNMLANLFLDQRLYFHNMLVANSPYLDGRDYRPFGAGWRNRVRALRNYIGNVQ